MKHISTGVMALLLAGTSALAVAAPAINVDKPMAAKGTLNIENLDGQVQVRAWDKPNVHIGGTLGDDAQTLRVTGSDNSLRIKVVYPKPQEDNDGANLIIDAPRSVSLVVATVSADVEVAGIAGTQRVQSVSGDVQLDGASNVVEAQSVSGDVSLQADDTLPGKVLLSTTSGDLLLAGTPAAGGLYALNAISGDSELSVPEDAAAAYDLRTISGSIDSAFGPEAGSSQASASTALVFSHGENGARIQARSVSGDISLGNSDED